MIWILLVEDEFASGEYLKSIIEKNLPQMEVTGLAENGDEALEMLRKQSCEIVISDIAMPRMDGLELARTIREHWPATYLVLVSGYERFDYAKSALSYGVCEYLLKPVKAAELTACLTRIAGRADLAARMRESLKKQETDDVSAEGILSKALNKTNSLDQVKAQLEVMLEVCTQELQGNPSDAFIRDDMEALRRYVEKHLNESLSLGGVSRALAMSPTSLNRMLRMRTNQSFVEYVTEHRMERAKELMDQSPKRRLKEIAAQVGYKDALYFSRVFRQYAGLSPTEYGKHREIK